MNIRDRVKELRRVPANTLVPNPRNWRVHPQSQANALRGVLAEIGLVDACLAVELPDGRLQLVDGHLRAETLGTEQVPVLVLDLTPDEADKVLLTLDPLAAMAEQDDGKLQELLAGFQSASDDVRMLAERLKATLAPPQVEFPDVTDLAPDTEPTPSTSTSQTVTCPQCQHRFEVRQ